jgi:protein ImuA
VNLSLPLFDFDDDIQDDVPGASPAAQPVAPAGVAPRAGSGAGLLAPQPPGSAHGPADLAGAVDGAAHEPPGLDLALHPAVWRASQLGAGAQATSPSGFAALDAELPGGGWPHGVLTELLLPQPGIGELRLLAPVLAAVSSTIPAPAAKPAAAPAASPARPGARPLRTVGASPVDTGGCVMLFDPPASLSAWALAQCGLDSRHWLVVRSRPGSQGRQASGSPVAAPLAWRPDTAPGVPRGASRLAPLLPGADVLWALEQALKSGQVGAVLAWLPVNLRADALRRLQLAAQAQAGPVFLFRDALARGRPSPAPLRLLLQPAGGDALVLRLLKRRGPQLAQPLRLQLPPVLPAALQARLQAQAEAQQLSQGLAGTAPH